ncbi:hypothetical protein L218DRAFT_939030 [Marasmius fiardii PR-910]|nr:hypothetical protein L218DRAFT_939030 [Marasmius fiardii PR-910]
MPDSVELSGNQERLRGGSSISGKRRGIEEGVYRICTQPFDEDQDRYDKLYLSIESGFVKVFPETRDDASLWRITQIYNPIDTFNINSPSTNLLHLNSTPKYRIENVGNREFLGLSRSLVLWPLTDFESSKRLTLVATKGFDSPLEVFISPPSKDDSGTTTQHKVCVYPFVAHVAH